MYCGTHSLIENATSGKWTERRSNNCTARMAKSACREVMARTSTYESRSHMSKLQSQMRSRLSLDNSDIHSCYWTSTSKTSPTNEYGTQRSCMRWVSGRAPTYNRGMSVLDILQGSILECTFLQRIAAGDCSMSVLWKISPAESISVCGEESTSAPGDKTTSEFRKRQYG